MNIFTTLTYLNQKECLEKNLTIALLNMISIWTQEREIIINEDKNCCYLDGGCLTAYEDAAYQLEWLGYVFDCGNQYILTTKGIKLYAFSINREDEAYEKYSYDKYIGAENIFPDEAKKNKEKYKIKSFVNFYLKDS
jgi:hypothetical protein